MEFPTIALGIAKTVVELSTEGACRRRIAEGAMRRDTLVTVYRGDAVGRVMRAGEVAELESVFLELVGPLVAPPSEAAAAAVEAPVTREPEARPAASADVPRQGAALPTPPPARSIEAPTRPPVKPVQAPPKPAEPAAPVAAPIVTKPPTRGGSGRPLLFVVGAIYVFWGLYVLGQDDKSGSDGAQLTVYVTRPVNVRAGAGPGFNGIAQLDRGTVLHGAWTTGSDGQTRWLQISDGTYQGDYAWGRNLSASEPPALSDGLAGNQVARVAGDIHAAPDETSTVVGSIAAGEAVSVAGVTGSWAEVLLQRNGGVGYLPRSTF